MNRAEQKAAPTAGRLMYEVAHWHGRSRGYMLIT
jgi:hypothetical protein